MNCVVVTGSFDNLKSRQVRFLEEASKLGTVHVLLWADAAVRALAGRPPKFPLAERWYMLQAVRYVSAVTAVADPIDPDALPTAAGLQPNIWAVNEASDSLQKKAYCAAHGLAYRVVTDRDLQGFPVTPLTNSVELASRKGHLRHKKVVVTGCYDWFHSGHVRFFEEVSELGDLYVIAGSDANVRLLKGEGHPLFPQDERRYFIQSIRYVKQALISTGQGWMDAEPEIALIKPDMYAVNEEGDKPEKREFCQTHGIQYVVLKRIPKEGLPRRQSTDLRGF
jgi:cytidyltransferase-like protein